MRSRILADEATPKGTDHWVQKVRVGLMPSGPIPRRRIPHALGPSPGAAPKSAHFLHSRAERRNSGLHEESLRDDLLELHRGIPVCRNFRISVCCCLPEQKKKCQNSRQETVLCLLLMQAAVQLKMSFESTPSDGTPRQEEATGNT